MNSTRETAITKQEIKSRLKAAFRLTEQLEAECSRNYSPELEARCDAAAKTYYDLCDQYPESAPKQRES